tara:strand:+ start:142 stop:342 length:201 start_codon:yes stop_codon:yes gene_type:complete
MRFLYQFDVKAVLVPAARLELARPKGQRILSPQRLPFRHAGPESLKLAGYPQSATKMPPAKRFCGI